MSVLSFQWLVCVVRVIHYFCTLKTAPWLINSIKDLEDLLACKIEIFYGRCFKGEGGVLYIQAIP